jgi:hypothetical protein
LRIADSRQAGESRALRIEPREVSLMAVKWGRRPSVRQEGHATPRLPREGAIRPGKVTRQTGVPAAPAKGVKSVPASGIETGSEACDEPAAAIPRGATGARSTRIAE